MPTHKFSSTLLMSSWEKMAEEDERNGDPRVGLLDGAGGITLPHPEGATR